MNKEPVWWNDLNSFVPLIRRYEREGAEDAFQEIALSLFQQFGVGNVPRGIVCSRIRQVLSGRFRRTGRRVSTTMLSADPVDYRASASGQEWLGEALEQVPPWIQSILSRRLDGFSFPQIAKDMGLPLEKVKSAAKRSILQLRLISQ